MTPRTLLLAGLLTVSPALATAQSVFLTPAQLKAALAHKNFLLVDVHVPYQGKIAGTDLMLPYDTIGQSRQLPKNKQTPIVLYCRSGVMSAEARQTLNGLGYRHVQELQGGFDAWKAAGYALRY